MRHSTDKLYVKPRGDAARTSRTSPEAVHNTMRIAEQCNVELKLGKPMLPTFKVPDGHTLGHVHRGARDEGPRGALQASSPHAARSSTAISTASGSSIELDVIHKMGFSGYFLIVQDFINWAKEHGIPVGPGRGSGAGSLVAYALRITDLDPIPYNLLFERFLNPERVSMPDFDVDFCQDRRDEVIKYVRTSTARTTSARSSPSAAQGARASSATSRRVMELPFAEGDKLAKLVPEPASPARRHRCARRSRRRAEAQQLSKREPGSPQGPARSSPCALEGLNRQPACTPPAWSSPTSRCGSTCPSTSGRKTTLVTQFAKDEVESAGLVKFDFLGLKTLTVIRPR